MSGRLAAGAAVVAALVAFVLSGVDAPTTLVGGASVLVVAMAWRRGSRPLATVGAAGLFAQLLLAGAAGVGPGSLLAAGVAVLLAWTFAHAAIDLRASLGDGPSRDLELAHVAGTTLLVGGAAAAAMLVWRVGPTDLSPLVVGLCLVGAVSLTVALRG